VSQEHDPVAALRASLTTVTSPEDALAILSFASVSTLREIEREFHLVPSASESILRLRLALSAYRRVSRGEAQRMDTSLVTPNVVRDWASCVLDEWLPGYTDFDEALGGQYHISRIKESGQSHGLAASLFQVSTADRQDPRAFVVGIGVGSVQEAAKLDSTQSVVAAAIRDFPFHDFGLDDVEQAADEWIGELATAIVSRLDANHAAILG
jgi:hypothetical protein